MAEIIGQNLYDLDMERSILSAILFSEDNLGEIYDLINPSDFYLKGHADVYGAMIECLNHDEPVDMAFVKKKLAKNFDDSGFTQMFPPILFWIYKKVLRALD